MKSYGVTEATSSSDDPLTTALEEIEHAGFAVIDRAIDTEHAAALSKALDAVLEGQIIRAGGRAVMDAIGDGNTARALLCENALFLEVLSIPILAGIVDALLGQPAIVLLQNGVVVPPTRGDHHQHSWHRDLPYQHWVANRPIALGALLALDPYDRHTGSTVFLPGSHRSPRLPSPRYVDRWKYQIEAEVGAIVVFDAMVFHRAGVNSSAGPRRAINTVFGLPPLAQQITLVPPAGTVVPPRVQRLLGATAPTGTTSERRHERTGQG